jgi:hypothetical protein
MSDSQQAFTVANVGMMLLFYCVSRSLESGLSNKVCGRLVIPNSGLPLKQQT